MYLQLQSKSRILDLHLTSGLHDWDMNEEIKLTTTTDQFYHGNIISVSNSLESAKQGRLLSITEVSWFGRWQADWPVSGAVALRQNLQKIITSTTSSSSQEFPAPAQRQRCVFIRHIPYNIISYHTIYRNKTQISQSMRGFSTEVYFIYLEWHFKFM